MRKHSKRPDANAALTRRETQKEIIVRWGEDYVRQARLRLCTDCDNRSRCFLYPVSLDGTDCPYFLRRGEK